MCQTVAPHYNLLDDCCILGKDSTTELQPQSISFFMCANACSYRSVQIPCNEYHNKMCFLQGFFRFLQR